MTGPAHAGEALVRPAQDRSCGLNPHQPFALSEDRAAQGLWAPAGVDPQRYSGEGGSSLSGPLPPTVGTLHLEGLAPCCKERASVRS